MKYLSATYIIIFGFLVLSSCSTGNKPHVANTYIGQKNPAPPAGFSPAPALQVSSIGTNTLPDFSPDGKSILFISSNRPRQKGKQIFEYDIANKALKQVTFLFGDVYDLTYNSKSNVIYYSSNTDEIKERPPLLTKKEFDQSTPPTEIYRMILPSGIIGRMTQHSGYDGQPQIHAKNHDLFYVQYKLGKYLIKKISNEKKNKNITIYSTKNKIEDLNISHVNNQLLWTEKINDTYQIYSSNLAGKKRKQISLDGKNHKNASWHPAGNYIIYSSNEENKNNYEIYVVDKDLKCRQRLTYNLGQDLHPKFDHSGTKIVFSSDRMGLFNIFIMDFVTPHPCT